MKLKLQFKKCWETFCAFLKRVKAIFPNILISIIITLGIAGLFGADYLALGLLFLFFQMMMMEAPFRITNYLKSCVILLCICILATLSEWSIPLSILLSFTLPFLLVILFSDDYTQKGYFIYGLAFFFIQASIPANPEHVLPTRLIAMLFGMTILLLYNCIMQKIRKTNMEDVLISSGLNTIAKRLKLLSKQKLSPETKSPLHNITEKLSTSLYQSVSHTANRFSPRSETTFQILLFLERMEHSIQDVYTHYDRYSEKDFTYFYELAHLLEYYIANRNTATTEELVAHITQFKAIYHLQDENRNYEWEYSLDKFQWMLQNAHTQKKATHIPIKEHFHIFIQHLKNNLSLDNSQTRFAIRLSLSVGIGMVISKFIPSTRAYWLPMTIYSLVQPFYEEEKQKLKSNAIGVILAAICFTLAFQFVPQTLALPFLFTVFTLLFTTKSDVFRTVMGSQLAMVLTYPMDGKVEVLVVRISLVLLAIAITWLIDRFVLHTTNYNALVKKVHHLLQTDRIILKELKRAITGEKDFRYINRFLLESYLLENLIITHEKAQEHYKGLYTTETILVYNKTFILDAEQLLYLFRFQTTVKIDPVEALSLIDKMDKTLLSAQEKCLGLQPEVQDVLDTKQLRTLKLNSDKNYSYAKKHFYFCAKNVSKLNEALEKKK